MTAHPFLFQTVTLMIAHHVVVETALGVSSNSPDSIVRLTAGNGWSCTTGGRMFTSEIKD